MNPLYQMLQGGQQPQQTNGSPQFQNPIQRMNYILEAMRNPAAFVRQQFPDVPASISNDPNQILRYLQQTRGISDQQIQQISSMYGRR